MIDRQRMPSDSQVFCAAFTAPGVNFDFVRNLLTFRQARKPRPFNRADVNEHIVSAVIGLDKAETLLAIEPLDSTCRHFLLQSTSRATITRFHSTGLCLWEIARRRIQKGTAANRTVETYGFSQQMQVTDEIPIRSGRPFNHLVGPTQRLKSFSPSSDDGHRSMRVAQAALRLGGRRSRCFRPPNRGSGLYSQPLPRAGYRSGSTTCFKWMRRKP